MNGKDPGVGAKRGRSSSPGDSDALKIRRVDDDTEIQRSLSTGEILLGRTPREPHPTHMKRHFHRDPDAAHLYSPKNRPPLHAFPHVRHAAPSRSRSWLRLVTSTRVNNADTVLLEMSRTHADSLVMEPSPFGPAVWGGMVTTRSDESLHNVFKKLVQHNVLSCPVLSHSNSIVPPKQLADKSSGGSERIESSSTPSSGIKSPSFVTFIDVLDLVNFLARHVDQLTSIETAGEHDQDEKQQLQQSAAVSRVFRDCTVSDVLSRRDYYHGRNPYHPVITGFSLFHCFEIMAKTGAHRVPIVDYDGHLRSLLTQSRLIRWFYERRSQLINMLHTKLEDLPELFEKQLIIVEEQERVGEAFRRLASGRYGGIAVVKDVQGCMCERDCGPKWGESKTTSPDDSGGASATKPPKVARLSSLGRPLNCYSLVDCLSVRDLRGLYGTDTSGEGNFRWLFGPVAGFKKSIRMRFRGRLPERRNSPLFVFKCCPLMRVLKTMVMHKVHRVYIVRLRGSESAEQDESSGRAKETPTTDEGKDDAPPKSSADSLPTPSKKRGQCSHRWQELRDRCTEPDGQLVPVNVITQTDVLRVIFRLLVTKM